MELLICSITSNFIRYRGLKMVSLKEHMEILRKLRFPYKKQLLTMLYHIFKEHTNEIPDLEEFIAYVMTPDTPIERLGTLKASKK